MKKRMSKILSMLLISALVVSTGSVVEAADMEGQTAQVQEADGEAAPAEDEAEAVPAEEVKEEVPAAVEEKAEVEKAEAPVKEAEEAPEMGIQVLESGEGNAIDELENVGLSKKIEAQVNEYYLSKPLELPAKGTLEISASYSNGDYWFGLFYDEALKTPVNGTGSVNASNPTSTKIFNVPAAGTYYYGAYSYDGEVYVTVQPPVFYDGSDRTLSNGTSIVVGQKDGQVNYFAFKAPYTGYLKAEGDANALSSAYCKVALCNSAKKALTGDTSLRYTPTYGVTKGKTYYIRVSASYNPQGRYTFRVTNKKITEKSGKSKSKAVNVKKNKTIKGTIQVGSSQADWYKLKVTSNKKITINTTISTNDKIKIVVYKGGKQMYSRVAPNNTKLKIYSLGKVSKGTYYVKVQRANKNSSGYYTLKWK